MDNDSELHPEVTSSVQTIRTSTRPIPGSFGIWSAEFRTSPPEALADAAAELEEMGYAMLWLPGGAQGDVLGRVGEILGATKHLSVGTGVLNIWINSSPEVAATHAAIARDHPGRFVLGLGISHEPLVRTLGKVYERPLQTMGKYLDELDDLDPTGPGDRVLAALGPNMLELAARRSAGAHPYLVTPEHTASARLTLGPEPWLAPEQPVLLESDPGRARSIARRHLSIYLSLPNYVHNFQRQGFSEDDFRDGGSDRLVDSIVAWGDIDSVLERVQAHRDAGADHVAVHVVPHYDQNSFPLAVWRLLAEAMTT